MGLGGVRCASLCECGKIEIMKRRTKVSLSIALFALMGLYNLPYFWTTPSAAEFWQRPLFGFLPASIAYYLVWLALTVPFGWWLLRVMRSDAR